MSEPSSRIVQLTPEQRDLLLRRARDRRASGQAGTGLIPRRKDREAPVPLSFAQQRLWLLDQLQPESPAYNVPVAVLITGPLRVDLFQKTLDDLVARHESLRTTFAPAAGQVFQVVAASGSFPLNVVDLADLDPEGPQPELEDLCLAPSLRPFDLCRGPLARATLFRFHAERFVLLLVLHHIISDLWSLGVFMRELLAIYDARVRGETASLPELPIQYPDFAVWQRERLQGDLLEQQIAHWKGELAGVPRILELPWDWPRPAVLGYRGQRLPWELSARSAGVLKSLGQKTGATLFMTLLAGFAALLARYSGQEVLVIGSPIANRTRVELEGQIGFFINMLVLRADLSGRPGFREVLGRVRERCVKALAHQELPFEQLIDELGIERDLSRQPLIQAALALQNVALPSLTATGLCLEPLDLPVETAKFDLSFELQEKATGLAGWLEYSDELFERVTAERMGRHFARLLEEVGMDPDIGVWDLPLLTREERQQLLSWQGRDEETGTAAILGDLFAAAVAEHPERVAVTWKGGELLYRELAVRSSQIAAFLSRHGVGPEVPVAVLLQRSPALVAGLLGVLEAGGAAVLLDPAERRSALVRTLEGTAAAVLLTEEALAAHLPEHGAEVAVIEEIGEENVAPRGGAVLPRSLALVVRSGDGGQPRLVAWEHHGLAAGARRWAEVLAPGELDGVLSGSPLGSLDSVFELLVPLCYGGRIVLAGEGAQGLDGGVSLLGVTPSLLAARLREGWVAEGLMAVRTSGEAFGAPFCQRLFAVTQIERIYSAYSSAAAGSRPWSVSRRGQPSEPWVADPGVGRAVHVLDDEGRRVPIGVVGELCIAGEGLARGYLADGERTASRFVPASLGERPGERLFRTGERARWRSGGGLELLGPAVEVRGIRVDLWAVARQAAEHPKIGQAVVLLQEGKESPVLTAYVVGREGVRPSPLEVREFLRERMPDAAVPRAIVVLDQLPLTPSGQVDLTALPSPEEGEDRGMVEPRTEVERIIAEIWCELLEAEAVGINDNFFQSGGNSLLATQVVARLNDTFQINVSLESIFRRSTIADLALIVDEQLIGQLADEELAALLADPRAEP